MAKAPRPKETPTEARQRKAQLAVLAIAESDDTPEVKHRELARLAAFATTTKASIVIPPLEPTETCTLSERVDGPKHSWQWMGDDPVIRCVFCGEMRDAIDGRVFQPGRQPVSVESEQCHIPGAHYGPLPEADPLEERVADPKPRSYFTALVVKLQRGEITKREFIAQCVKDGVPVTTAAIVADGALAKRKKP